MSELLSTTMFNNRQMFITRRIKTRHNLVKLITETLNYNLYKDEYQQTGTMYLG